MALNWETKEDQEQKDLTIEGIDKPCAVGNIFPELESELLYCAQLPETYNKYFKPIKIISETNIWLK